MAKTDEKFLDGFSEIGDFLMNPGMGVNPDMDNEIPEIDPEDLEMDEEEVTPPAKDKNVETEEVDEEDEEEEADDTTEDVDDADDSDPEIEKDITKLFSDKVAEKLGWDFAEDEKFESVEDFVDYLTNVVEEASKPQFANEEIEKFDEFVRNGGNLKEFYDKIHAGKLELDKVDIDSDYDQKSLIKEFLKTQGIKDSIIDKRIERYDEAGVLQDEAEEALEYLKEHRQKEEQKLLEEQKNLSKVKLQHQQEFVKSVQTNINDINEIRGYKLTDKEKRDLVDYIFKPTSDGLTGFQKDYQSNIKNLIESAYFTKNGDKLIKNVKEKAKSDAYKEIQQKLKTKKQKTRSNGYESDGGSFNLGSLGSSLLKKI